jgi:hypothetical protein
LLNEDEVEMKKRSYATALNLSLHECDLYGVFVDGVTLVGYPFGSAPYVESWLSGKVQEVRCEFDKIIGYPDLQKGWTMFRMVFLNKVMYLQRCIAWEVLSYNFLPCISQLIDSFVNNICNQEVTESGLAQAKLPIHDGGLGLGDLKLISKAAQFASICTVIGQLDVDGSVDDIKLSNWCREFTQCKDFIAFNALISKEDICVGSKYAISYRDGFSWEICSELGLQSDLQNTVYKSLVKAKVNGFKCMDGLSVEEASRRKSVVGKESGLFLEAVSRGNNRMTNAQFSTAIQARYVFHISDDKV